MSAVKSFLSWARSASFPTCRAAAALQSVPTAVWERDPGGGGCAAVSSQWAPRPRPAGARALPRGAETPGGCPAPPAGATWPGPGSKRCGGRASAPRWPHPRAAAPAAAWLCERRCRAGAGGSGCGKWPLRQDTAYPQVLRTAPRTQTRRSCRAQTSRNHTEGAENKDTVSTHK